LYYQADKSSLNFARPATNGVQLLPKSVQPAPPRDCKKAAK
jgi:hypothetical protein